MIEQDAFLTEEHEQRIKDFTLYANFIANQFDIQVVLDTHHAHTDGKVISLPNVANLSEDELNAMYAILLHEAGHIRYSDFSENYFARLKTHMHAFFANCFEDARIENLLCSDFDGATNIFEQLYTVHAINPAINYRLFGFNERNGDTAFAFGAFLHNIKCNFTTADVLDIDPKATKVVKILQQNLQFIQQVQAHPLKTTEDTLALSEIAYNFFVKHFTDKTEKISIEKDRAVAENIAKKIGDISTRASELEVVMDTARKERLEKEKAYKSAVENVAEQIANLTARASSLKNSLTPVSDFNRAKNRAYDQLDTAVRALEKNNNTEVNRDKILNSIERRYKAIERAQKKIEDANTFVPKTTADMLKTGLQNNQTKFDFGTPNTENPEVDKQINAEIARLNKYVEDYKKKNSVISDRINNANNALANKNSYVEEMKKSLSETLKAESNVPYEFKQEFQEQIAQMEKDIAALEDISFEQVKAQNEANKSVQQSESEQNSDSDSDEFGDEEVGSEGNQQTQSYNSSEGSQSNDGNSQSGSGKYQGENSTEEASISDVGDILSRMNSSLNETMKKIADLEAPYKTLKEAMQQARSKEREAQERMNQALQQAFNEIINAQRNAEKDNSYDSQLPFQNPLDMLFEETPGWESADDYQRSFDERATKETGQLVVNGQKLAGTGSGSRSVSVLLNQMKNDVESINLADCFKETLAGSLLDQGNEAGFENFGSEKGSTINSDSYIAKLATTGRHSVLTTQFDKIEVRITPENKENEAEQLLRERSMIVNQLKEEIKKKMKVTKKPRFVGAKDEGDLDARNLWKIPARRGSDVFEQNNPKFVNNVAASVLVDISGSLNNDSTKEGTELKFIAAALSEALQSCYVMHEVLGYHAPYSYEMAELKSDPSYNRRNHYVETVVFKNFKQKDGKGIDNLELQSSDNSDGESLRIAMKRLLQQRAKNRVLFMITDAKPFLTGSNVLKLDKDLYDALQEAKRKKIQIVGIGYNADKTGIFGKNFIQIKDNTYKDLIDCVKNLQLKID